MSAREITTIGDPVLRKRAREQVVRGLGAGTLQHEVDHSTPP